MRNNLSQQPPPPGKTPEAINTVCRRCHENINEEHILGVNPFLDPAALVQLENAPVSGRGIFCIDCHTPHGEDKNDALLTNHYFRLCQLSRAINPHWQKLMCGSCHLDRFPVKGQTRLLSNGDINYVCNRCHHSEFARKEIHPVGIKPSPNITMPGDMLLTEGKLTCTTCHQCELQQYVQTGSDIPYTNRNFLRHGTISRAQYCFLCHINEAYRRLNPHKQLDADGKIIEETCLFCHASRPDIQVATPNSVTFIINNPVNYCIGCHPGFEHRHPSGGEHLVEPSAKILKSLSTSVARIGVELPLFAGKIVCTTCHNPHERGVIQISAAAEGSQHRHKLRLVPGKNQCTGCHWDK